MACEKAGGYLLVIDDGLENDFIKQILSDNTWLGLQMKKLNLIGDGLIINL